MSKLNPITIALVLAFAYLVWPIDILPDVFGPLGRIDDLLIFALVAWQAYRLKRKAAQSTASPATDSAKPHRSPHEVLGVNPGSSPEEIDARYRQLAQQYHPDKVSHLGEDLQKLAHEKMLEITEAYRALTA